MKSSQHIVSISICLSVMSCILSFAASNQSIVLTLIPDTHQPPGPESLNCAREILQKRFDIALPENARLSAIDRGLKLELASKEFVDVATRLAIETGEIVFFLSDTALVVGSAMPDGVSPVITDREITEAKPSSALGNSWSIRVKFSEEGAKKLRDHTRGNVGRYMIIAKDGTVISAPVIRSEIEGNGVEIAGSDDVDSARLMVAQLGSGRLPFKFRITEGH